MLGFLFICILCLFLIGAPIFVALGMGTTPVSYTHLGILRVSDCSSHAGGIFQQTGAFAGTDVCIYRSGAVGALSCGRHALEMCIRDRFDIQGEKKVAKAIEYVKGGEKKEIALTEDDFVFITNGSLSLIHI